MSTFDPEKITFFAKTDARGQQVPFGIKAKDRQRHMYVVGKTGMGKSTLLENMAAQDIKNGEGMAFIDPHGSAAETLLEYVPEERINDVVYFAPFDLDYPVSFNVMEDVGEDKRHLVVSGLMSTFKKIWVDAWSARMEYILTNALLVLIEYPDTTLLSVNRLFNDKAYRTRVVDYCQDPAVKAYWTEEFANYTERFAAEALPAIQNKIGQFTGNPLIRNIIGQPHSSFDIRKLMDERKILIMNLSKGLIGETNANLLGSMLTTRIYLAAMSRANLPVAEMKKMPNFYFYVDEFQSFANSTFANILSEARKYHLNLIIAHQYIAQMEEEVRDAVFGNVGTTISFRVGPFDGEVLETVFQPRFMATDLVNLGFAQIYLTLMIDGVGSQPFSAETLPPIETPAISHRGQVTTSSRKLYAKPRAEVQEAVTKLHTPDPQPDKPNKGGAKNGGGNYKGNTKPGGGKPTGGGKPNTQLLDSHTKSSADLKAILAGMTGGAKSVDKQPNTTSPVAKPKHAEKSAVQEREVSRKEVVSTTREESASESKPESISSVAEAGKSANRPKREPEQKRERTAAQSAATSARIAQNPKVDREQLPSKFTHTSRKTFPAAKHQDPKENISSLDEKRSALAAALAAATGTTVESKKVDSEPKSQPQKPVEQKPKQANTMSQRSNERPQATTSAPNRSADLQASLQAALKKVQPPQVRRTQTKSEEGGRLAAEEKRESSAGAPEKLQEPPARRPTITVESRRSTLPSLTPVSLQSTETPAVEAGVQTTATDEPAREIKRPARFAPQTAPAAPRTASDYDTDKIKKMLQHSGNERSPFIS